jgi:hypothetical protein
MQFQLLDTANAIPKSPLLSTLIMEVLGIPETSVVTRATRRHIPKENIPHSHRRQNLKPYRVYRVSGSGRLQLERTKMNKNILRERSR